MGGVSGQEAPTPSIRQARAVALAADVKYNTLLHLRRQGVVIPEEIVQRAYQEALNAGESLRISWRKHRWKLWDR